MSESAGGGNEQTKRLALWSLRSIGPAAVGAIAEVRAVIDNSDNPFHCAVAAQVLEGIGETAVSALPCLLRALKREMPEDWRDIDKLRARNCYLIAMIKIGVRVNPEFFRAMQCENSRLREEVVSMLREVVLIHQPSEPGKGSVEPPQD